MDGQWQVGQDGHRVLPNRDVEVGVIGPSAPLSFHKCVTAHGVLLDVRKISAAAGG